AYRCDRYQEVIAHPLPHSRPPAERHQFPPRQRLLFRADCKGSVLPFLSAIRPQPISSARPDQAPHHAKKFNFAVTRLYIAPAILIMPLDSSSASTGLFLRMSVRSEERRVGKECRSRWWPE